MHKFSQRTQVDCIFINLCKIFAIKFCFLNWIILGYGRSCRVLYGGELSNSFDAVSDVPQVGCHLGTILLILYNIYIIDDFTTVFKYSECKTYADDVRIYSLIGSFIWFAIITIRSWCFFSNCKSWLKIVYTKQYKIKFNLSSVIIVVFVCK